VVDPVGDEREVGHMAERAHREPAPRNPFVLSFAWMAVVGRLLRTRTFNTGGFGDSGGSDGRVLPWYCELDKPRDIKWYPESLGVPSCDDRAHRKDGRKMLLDEDLAVKTYGALPDLKSLGL
jgi:hypothetical protein